MIKIEETETYGWKAAIRGMRNPKNSWDKSDSGICYKEVACHSCNENRNNCAYNLEHDGFVIGDNDIERTYILEGVRPKPSTIKCGDQTFKFVGNIVDEGFDEPNSCESSSDPVNHPNHYEMVGPFESFDIIVESLGIYGARQFCQGNIIKYQTRYKEKNGEEDLKKRHWYSRMDQMLAKCKTIEDYYKLKESDFNGIR